MRRRPVTLPENEKLISPTVSGSSLIHLIEGKQGVTESIANALLVRAPQ